MEEIDEEWMNRTINTLDIGTEYILKSIQEYAEKIWINKTNMATELAMVENLKKKDLSLEEMNSMNIWTFSMNKRQINSPFLDPRIIRLK